MPRGMEVFDADEHIDPASYKPKTGAPKKVAASKKVQKEKYVCYDAESKKRKGQDSMGLKDRAPDEESFDVDTDNAYGAKESEY